MVIYTTPIDGYNRRRSYHNGNYYYSPYPTYQTYTRSNSLPQQQSQGADPYSQQNYYQSYEQYYQTWNYYHQYYYPINYSNYSGQYPQASTAQPNYYYNTSDLTNSTNGTLNKSIKPPHDQISSNQIPQTASPPKDSPSSPSRKDSLSNHLPTKKLNGWSGKLFQPKKLDKIKFQLGRSVFQSPSPNSLTSTTGCELVVNGPNSPEKTQDEESNQSIHIDPVIETDENAVSLPASELEEAKSTEEPKPDQNTDIPDSEKIEVTNETDQPLPEINPSDIAQDPQSSDGEEAHEVIHYVKDFSQQSLILNQYLTRHQLKEISKINADLENSKLGEFDDPNSVSDMGQSKLRFGPLSKLKQSFIPGKMVWVTWGKVDAYPAKVIKTKGTRVSVRYEGWGEYHDEWIEMNSSRILLQKPYHLDNKEKEAEQPDSTPKVNDQIMVKDRTGIWCEAVISSIKQDKVLISFPSQPRVRGEWIPLSSDRIKSMKEFNNDDELKSTIPLPLPVKPTKNKVVKKPIIKPSQMKKIEKTLEHLEYIVDNPVDIETVNPTEEAVESKFWHIYCNICHIVLKQYRFYCAHCESPAEDSSFDLCFWCYQNSFPKEHPHPAQSFAVDCLITEETIDSFAVNQVKDSLILTPFTKDKYYNGPSLDNSLCNPICALCHDIQCSEVTGPFINEKPFLFTSLSTKVSGVKTAHKKNIFWIHQNCAQTSPQTIVFHLKDPEKEAWYNLDRTVYRASKMKCTKCRMMGATVGCFNAKCPRIYHLTCCDKNPKLFLQGYIFYCPKHEAIENKKQSYEEYYHCDHCKNSLPKPNALGPFPDYSPDEWFTCQACVEENFFSGFDLCTECFTHKFKSIKHNHKANRFIRTTKDKLEVLLDELANNKLTLKNNKLKGRKSLKNDKFDSIEDTKDNAKTENSVPKKRKIIKKVIQYQPNIHCSYCWSTSSTIWRRGYMGVLLCSKCFMNTSTDKNLASTATQSTSELIEDDQDSEELIIDVVNDLPSPPAQQDKFGYHGNYEDYIHQPYHTRNLPQLNCLKYDPSQIAESSVMANKAIHLETYGPTIYQAFSLDYKSTYYDIPGSAPRWASHSGSDYHGTWLPQTVRRAITRYTKEGDMVLSNFLGRGTDAIECFLLKRKCIGIDINPVAVSLSQKNISFALPPSLLANSEFKYHRPTIIQGDARNLFNILTNESISHVLSHPPYKDCVEYSNNIDGDLSKFSTNMEFCKEMQNVVNETWRVLKMGGRCTLGIGDNRDQCFYQPVSFDLLLLYMETGFQVEEIIVKRQRQCRAFGLGTFLCVKYDFLMFTHEFIITLRKVPINNRGSMSRNMKKNFKPAKEISRWRHMVGYRTKVRQIPDCPIERKSVIMGSVWVFRPNHKYSFPGLCVSRMVERFGRNNTNWEEVILRFKKSNINGENATTEDPHIIAPEPAPINSNYEKMIQGRIKSNKQKLLSLGLISELSDDRSEDIIHHDKMQKMKNLPNAPISLIVVPHIPNHKLDDEIIPFYRRSLVEMALYALQTLPPSGMLIVGVQDYRATDNTLVPLTALVYQDINDIIKGRDHMKLKELVVCVPQGYSCDRSKEYSKIPKQHCVVGEKLNEVGHLPIVHAIYMIFMKLK